MIHRKNAIFMEHGVLCFVPVPYKLVYIQRHWNIHLQKACFHSPSKYPIKNVFT
jgi:hypothetical protein